MKFEEACEWLSDNLLWLIGAILVAVIGIVWAIWGWQAAAWTTGVIVVVVLAVLAWMLKDFHWG